MPDLGQGRPTSHDVARAAGVSQSTVSRVLSGNTGRVSRATADRIRRAAEALRYRPNLSARSLRMDHTGTILLIVPTLTNSFFAYLHAGAASVAAAHHDSVLVFPLDTEEGNDRLPLPRQAIDGLLALSHGDRRLAAALGDVPTVGIESAPTPGHVHVNTDIAGSVRQIAAHLLGLGHRRLGYLHVERHGVWLFEERLRALRTEVDRDPAASLWIAPTTFDIREARQAVTRLLERPDRPTALICEDDNLAIAAYAAAHNLGLSIPQDLSVIGYNDLPIADALDPTLTTINIPAAELGGRAMRALSAVLRGEEPCTTPLATTLVVRGSTARRM